MSHGRPWSDAPIPIGRVGPEPGRHNLPQPLTSFIGRQAEVAEARHLLGATRLLTLTGTGGVGKTRLGHEVAACMVDAFEGGVWLVELAALADPALVPQAVAAVLGVREGAEHPLLATLIDALRGEHLLLVLDNCEHLIEACAEFAETTLRACPGLRILATSRQPLGIAGETTFRLPPLALSALSATATAIADDEAREAETGPGPAVGPIGASAASEAVRLFVERARAAAPGFTLTERNTAAVVEICRRLDGIPLAIELAAARVSVLSPEQIAARLGDRFRLLTGGSRTALPRHRTVRALIDWGHDLLDDGEKILLRRLAVFAGGWTLAAAEAVCAGEGLASDEVLDALSGLVTKSLVQADARGGDVRYHFLETVRSYAAERLREAGEEAALRDLHRDWLLALAEEAEPGLTGPHAVSWMRQLECERDNLRAAFASCIGSGATEAGLRLLGALTRFWLVRGPFREIRGVLSELLALPTPEESSAPMQAARARALYAGVRLAMRQGDYASADVHLRDALAVWGRLDDRRGLATALFSSGHIARLRGEYPAARSRYEESLRLFEALDDAFWMAQVQHELGVAAYFQGDLPTAHTHYAASLELYGRLGDDPGIVAALNELGEVALAQGELETARSLECRALRMARAIGDRERIAMSLAGLAGLAAAQDRPTRALRLIGAATALNEAAGQRNSAAWYAMVDHWLEPARGGLGAEAVAAAHAAGRAMSVDEAIDYALASDESATGARRTDGSSSRPMQHGPQAAPSAGALTQREQEVAALVARGLTNRQIAEELVITEWTAASHVKHILAKLTLDSRVQIATWAIEHGVHRRSAAN